MFEILLKVVPLSVDAFKWLFNRQDRKREEFASLCERITENLESFARASDDERRSRNLCNELKVYVPAIENMAEGIMEDNQLKDMAEALNTVCETWKEHREKQENNLHVDARDLLEVQDAAGHFRGLATLVRHNS
jgi:hypothetical protein